MLTFLHKQTAGDVTLGAGERAMANIWVQNVLNCENSCADNMCLSVFTKREIDLLECAFDLDQYEGAKQTHLVTSYVSCRALDRYQLLQYWQCVAHGRQAASAHAPSNLDGHPVE